MSYTDKAIVEIQKRGIKSDDIKKLGYQDIASLCGVVIKENGDSPSDFFYETIRSEIMSTLERKIEEEVKVEINSAINTIISLEKYTTVKDRITTKV